MIQLKLNSNSDCNSEHNICFKRLLFRDISSQGVSLNCPDIFPTPSNIPALLNYLKLILINCSNIRLQFLLAHLHVNQRLIETE